MYGVISIFLSTLIFFVCLNYAYYIQVLKYSKKKKKSEILEYVLHEV